MKKIVIAMAMFTSISVNAGFEEKVAASFAAKYEVCALKLKDSNPLMAINLKINADKISKDKLGGGGYIKAYKKEKKKAWFLSKKKCRNLAQKL